MMLQLIPLLSIISFSDAFSTAPPSSYFTLDKLLTPYPETFSDFSDVGTILNGTNTASDTNITGIQQPRRQCAALLLNKVNFVCLMVFIPVTIFGNALVCLVVFTNKKLYKQSMYIFVSSLAVADICVGTITMPIKAHIQWNGSCFHLPFFACWIYTMGEIVFSISSTLHLSVIALDKYLSLRITYQYVSNMTKYKRLCVVLAVWMFALVCSLLSIFNWKKPSRFSIFRGRNGCSMLNIYYFITVYVLLFILPIFLMIFMYSFIYNVTLSHINEISKLQVLDSAKKKEKRRKQKQFKTFRSIIIVFMAYTLCWLPMVILVLCIYSFSDAYRMRLFPQEWWRSLGFVIINFLPHFNSTLNPFIYVFFNKEFLTALHISFKKVTGKSLSKAMRTNTSMDTSHRLSTYVEPGSLAPPRISTVTKDSPASSRKDTSTTII